MSETAVEFEEALHDENAKSGDCFCEWMTKDEIQRRELMAATIAESRTEAVRLLRLAEARAAGDPGLLVHIALAWKDVARLH